ncbi:hypothetical protein N9N28_16025 [Rubripirellula amarantea]|nr:hypothetical protein [Rubripirellula amarantea]
MFGSKKQGEPHYQDRLRNRLERLPLCNPPAPWRLVGGSFIGGLTEIGFIGGTADLLVVSSEGRALFDTLTGQKLSHDPSPRFEDPCAIHRMVPAIGKHIGIAVALVGPHGGGLSRATDDGWLIDVIPLPWPCHYLFLSSNYLRAFDGGGHTWKLCDDAPWSFRAAGFSDSGSTFVFATSGEIVIYSRAEG